jgi:hypothetical protein
LWLLFSDSISWFCLRLALYSAYSWYYKCELLCLPLLLILDYNFSLSIYCRKLMVGRGLGQLEFFPTHRHTQTHTHLYLLVCVFMREERTKDIFTLQGCSCCQSFLFYHCPLRHTHAGLPAFMLYFLKTVPEEVK